MELTIGIIIVGIFAIGFAMGWVTGKHRERGWFMGGIPDVMHRIDRLERLMLSRFNQTDDFINNLITEVKHMSIALDNLTAADAALKAEVAEVATSIKEKLDKIAALTAQIAGENPDESAAIQAIADDVTAQAAALHTAATT